jgi:hypothetical protein
LAQALGKKYQTNWFSAGLQQPGLAEVLRHGPILCIPDDHEFWNNYPLFQAQLDNTHCAEDRATWGELANRLYERYQRSPAQRQGFFRWDLAPMSMLFLDSRTQRDAVGDAMFNGATLAALTQWKQDLLARKQQQLPAVGLIGSGQALLMEKPGFWARHCADMEMVNYRDFAQLEAVFIELFAAEIPVIYITGDVHWGRIVSGRNQRGQTLFYEVIASPSRLLDTLGNDQLNSAKNWLRSWQGQAETFPLHPAPQPVSGLKFANLHLQLEHSQRGDHVALLRFNSAPGGLEFYVDYVCTHADERTRQQQSPSCGPFSLKSV